MLIYPRTSKKHGEGEGEADGSEDVFDLGSLGRYGWDGWSGWQSTQATF